jgi:hypothetical protein
MASVRPETLTLAERGVIVPSPSCPSSLRPQQLTPPSWRNTQLAEPPAESATIGLAAQEAATQASELSPAACR